MPCVGGESAEPADTGLLRLSAFSEHERRVVAALDVDTFPQSLYHIKYQLEASCIRLLYCPIIVKDIEIRIDHCSSRTTARRCRKSRLLRDHINGLRFGPFLRKLGVRVCSDPKGTCGEGANEPNNDPNQDSVIPFHLHHVCPSLLTRFKTPGSFLEQPAIRSGLPIAFA